MHPRIDNLENAFRQTSLVVSILVTVYNREAYLEDALYSILASTFSNFEVIVVDDCSVDQSPEIARRVGGQDERIRIVQNERNLGDYGNRMKAAELATGKYLKYVDSDDLIYPHSLQVMVDAMEKHPDAVLGLAHSLPEDEEPYPWRLTPELAYKKQFLGRGCLNCGPTGAIIRRDAFEAIGGFREEWGVLSDTELWLRMAASSPVVLLPPGLVWWRRHEGQQFTTGNAASVYLDKGHQVGIAALTSEACPLSVADRNSSLKACRQRYARRLLSLAIRSGEPLTAAKLFRSSCLTVFDLFSGFKHYT